MTKPTLRITRFHLTDLECAAMNDPACKPILDKMKEDYELQIDEQPVPGVFYTDMTINFMYPHTIEMLDLSTIPSTEHSISAAVTESGKRYLHETLGNLASFAAMESLHPNFKNTFDAVRALAMSETDFKLHDFGARGVESAVHPIEAYLPVNGFKSKVTKNVD